VNDSTIERIDAALTSHEFRKGWLSSVIESGSSEWGPQRVKADNQCDLGKWLYACSPQEKAMPCYDVVKHLHAQFHIEGGRILDIALRGDRDNALAEMAEGRRYAEISAALVHELLNWKAELIEERT
jgi:hypothetical protein